MIGEYGAVNVVLSSPAQSDRYGLNYVSFRGSLLWNTLDDEIKSTLMKFERGITKWNGKLFKCLICRQELTCIVV